MSSAMKVQSPNHWTAREFPELNFKFVSINLNLNSLMWLVAVVLDGTDPALMDKKGTTV